MPQERCSSDAELNLDVEPFLLKERVRRIQNRLDDCKRKRVRKIKTPSNESNSHFHLDSYSYCTSVLIGLLGDNVKDKTIVEIGPGYFGRYMLDLLANDGAMVIGLDRVDGKLYKKPLCGGGKYVIAPMEKMSDVIPRESTDLINIMHMNPSPWDWDVGRAYSYGNFFQRRKVKLAIEMYDSLVSKQLNFILKKGGYVTVWYCPVGDFRLRPADVIKAGFTHWEYDTFMRIPGYCLDVYQKQ